LGAVLMKDAPDRSDGFLPARRSHVPPPAPAFEAAGDAADPGSHPGPSPRGGWLKVVGRALRRYWWQGLLLWAAGTAALAALACAGIKPTFDAVSRIKVENDPFSPNTEKNAADPVDFAQFLETQVSTLTSPTVIDAALAARPELNALPMLRGSADPGGDLRKALRVAVIAKTSLIQVEMSSAFPTEAADLVNAVVDAYLKVASEDRDAWTQKQIDRLAEKSREQQAEVDRRRKEVARLQHEQRAAGTAEDRKNAAAVDTFRRLSEALTDVEILTIATRAKLDQLSGEKALPARGTERDRVEAAVTDLFYADPRVAALQAQRERAEAWLAQVRRLARNGSDPALAQATEQVKSLTGKINDYWAKLAPGLRRKAAAAPRDNDVDRQVRQTELELAAMTRQAETLSRKLEQVRADSRAAEGEALKLDFARRDLERSEAVLDKVRNMLDALKYSAGNTVARVNRVFKAAATSRPDADRRLQALAAAPVLSGLLVLGLLVTLERRGARVGDPDELSRRVNLEVLGVVPPLPKIRAGGPGPAAGPPTTPAELRARRQLDAFVQSLDHLRVALCARRDPWGRDRHCLLITSACGSEGKTTLAAQLAERCVNAGLMTLLVDADLRNPTLSRMLDAPENPGLINVLRGEMTAEDVVMVIGDAGGFHLMPAGTPRMDPSRLLASDRLGKLLAQARESFDMILIDAPPVLPVPDALTIGRWADGAVLAVRCDTSRFPLVERASRRLAHVGVHVIGAVVNGVRSLESTYGGYYPYGGYGGYGPDLGNGDGGASATPEAPSPAGSDD
jgi:capsular exopolysaccharide synthesis family protein